MESGKQPSPWWPGTRNGQVLLVAWLALNLAVNGWFVNPAAGVVAAAMWYLTIAALRGLLYPTTRRPAQR